MSNPYLKDFGLGDEEPTRENTQSENPYLKDFLGEPKSTEPKEPEQSAPLSSFGVRDVAKGLARGGVEVPGFFARIGGEYVSGAVDRLEGEPLSEPQGLAATPEAEVGSTGGRKLIKPAEIELELIPGMVHAHVTKQIDAEFSSSKLNDTVQDRVTEIANGIADNTVDFMFDVLPSMVKDDWKPQVGDPRKAEIIQNSPYNPINALFGVISWIPERAKEATLNATGSPFVANTVMLAMFHGIGKTLAGAKDSIRMSLKKADPKIVEKTLEELKQKEAQAKAIPPELVKTEEKPLSNGDSIRVYETESGERLEVKKGAKQTEDAHIQELIKQNEKMQAELKALQELVTTQKVDAQSTKVQEVLDKPKEYHKKPAPTTEPIIDWDEYDRAVAGLEKPVSPEWLKEKAEVEGPKGPPKGGSGIKLLAEGEKPVTGSYRRLKNGRLQRYNKKGKWRFAKDPEVAARKAAKEQKLTEKMEGESKAFVESMTPRQLAEKRKAELPRPKEGLTEPTVPEPPTRLPSQAPKKGMAKGRFRFSRGFIFDPEGKKVNAGARYGTTEGLALTQKLNVEHGFVEGGQSFRAKRLGNLKRALVNHTVNYRTQIHLALKRGSTIQEIQKYLRETYANMPKATQQAYKQRYTSVIQHTISVEKDLAAKERQGWGERPTLPRRMVDDVPAAAPKLEASGPTLQQTPKATPKVTGPGEFAPGKPEKRRHQRSTQSPYHESEVPDLKTLESDVKALKTNLRFETIRYRNFEKTNPLNAENATQHIIFKDKIRKLEEGLERLKARKIELQKREITIEKKPTVFDKTEKRMQEGFAFDEKQNKWVKTSEVERFNREKKSYDVEMGGDELGARRAAKEGRDWVNPELDPKVAPILRKILEADEKGQTYVPTPEEAKIMKDAGHEFKGIELPEPTPITEGKREPVVKESASAITDDQLHAMHAQVFGDGMAASHMEPMLPESGASKLPYPDAEGRFADGSQLNAAILTPTGELIVGRGSGVGHALLNEFIPKEDQHFYVQNRATHTGMADQHGRFVSLQDLSKAGADFNRAFQEKFGAPDATTRYKAEDAIERIKEHGSKGADEWFWHATIEGRDVLIEKRKGQGHIVTVDGHPFKKQMSRPLLDSFIRGLTNRDGHAMILNHVAKEIIDHTNNARGIIAKLRLKVRQTLMPHTVSAEAGIAARSIAHWNAELDLARENLGLSYRKLHKELSRLTKQEAMDMWDALETGDFTGIDKKHVPFLRSMKAQIAEKWLEVVKRGGGETIYKEYFARYWKKPSNYPLGKITGRRPAKGPQNFRHPRRGERFSQMVNQFGLEPLSWNPVDHFLWKMGELDKFIAGHEIFTEFKDMGFAKFVREGEVLKEGYEWLDDPMGQVGFFDSHGKRFIRTGKWSLPEPVARVFNNYLRPGLYDRGHMWFNALREFNMNLNMVQLGISAYHWIMTSVDAVSSRVGMGLVELTRGQLARGVKDFTFGLTVLGPIAKQFASGSKMLRWAREINPARTTMIDALTKGGGGISLDKYYKIDSRAKFKQAIKDKKVISTALRAPGAGIEAISAVIMEWWVPRMKMGMFYEQALSIQEFWRKKGITPTLHMEREAYGKIWRSIDNRMGQFRYDNLHINRKLRDGVMVTSRAAGWNIGSFSEIGLAGVRPVQHISHGLRGKKFWKPELGETWLPAETAWVIGLVLTNSVVSSVYQWFRSGLAPGYPLDGGEWDISEFWTDVFYPKTGKKRPDGTPERSVFPSYIKDIKHWSMHPFQTAVNKLSPALQVLGDAYRNRDFYGKFIVDPDHWDWDKPVETVKDVSGDIGSYMWDQIMPFSYRNYDKRGMNPLAAFSGILPAPAEAGRTGAYLKAQEYNRRRYGNIPMTEDEANQRNLKWKYRKALQEQDEKTMADIVKEEGLTPEQIKNIRKAAGNDPLINAIQTLKPHEAVRVYREANEEERRKIKSSVIRKIVNSKTIFPGRKKELLEEIKEADGRL